MSDGAARRGADESSAIGRSAEQTDSPQRRSSGRDACHTAADGTHGGAVAAARAARGGRGAAAAGSPASRPLPRPRRAFHGARRSVRRAAARGARRRRRRAGACVAPARRRALRSPRAAPLRMRNALAACFPARTPALHCPRARTALTWHTRRARCGRALTAGAGCFRRRRVPPRRVRAASLLRPRRHRHHRGALRLH